VASSRGGSSHQPQEEDGGYPRGEREGLAVGGEACGRRVGERGSLRLVTPEDADARGRGSRSGTAISLVRR